MVGRSRARRHRLLLGRRHRLGFVVGRRLGHRRAHRGRRRRRGRRVEIDAGGEGHGIHDGQHRLGVLVFFVVLGDERLPQIPGPAGHGRGGTAQRHPGEEHQGQQEHGDQDHRGTPAPDPVAQRTAGRHPDPTAGPGQVGGRRRQPGSTSGHVGQTRDSRHRQDQPNGHPRLLPFERTHHQSHPGPGTAHGDHKSTDAEQGAKTVTQPLTHGPKGIAVQSQGSEHGGGEKGDAPDVFGVGAEHRSDRGQKTRRRRRLPTTPRVGRRAASGGLRAGLASRSLRLASTGGRPSRRSGAHGAALRGHHNAHNGNSSPNGTRGPGPAAHA